jgi:hypothetical protein
VIESPNGITLTGISQIDSMVFVLAALTELLEPANEKMNNPARIPARIFAPALLLIIMIRTLPVSF